MRPSPRCSPAARWLAVIAALVLVLLAAGPAEAKGPVAVRITGPGLPSAIVIRNGDYQAPVPGLGTETQQRSLSALMDGSGVWRALGNLETGGVTLAAKPAGDLGAQYRLRWSIPGLGTSAKGDDVLVQYAYLRPGTAPLVFTPPGQAVYGERRTVGSWMRAQASFTGILAAVGVPTTGAPAVPTTPAASPPARPSPTLTAPAPASLAPPSPVPATPRFTVAPAVAPPATQLDDQRQSRLLPRLPIALALLALLAGVTAWTSRRKRAASLIHGAGSAAVR